MILLIILFSIRKCQIESEIKEILEKFGGVFIDSKSVLNKNNSFEILTTRRSLNLTGAEFISLFINTSVKFKNQILPENSISICDENDFLALDILSKNKTRNIVCGMGFKNTVTLSSITPRAVTVCIQRTIFINENTQISPCEITIMLSKKYDPFSIMAATILLLMSKIEPREF